MSDDGRAELLRFSSNLLDAFVKAIEQAHGNAPITLRQLMEAAERIEKSPGFSALVDTAYRRLMEEATHGLLKQRRHDPFRRLLAHPLTEMFQSGALNRDILPSFFSFLHLVMGDQANVMAERCSEVSKNMHKGEFFDWDSFYADPAAKIVLWTVLTRIAESFRRFEARRDWFIALMQNKPQAVSLASNAFIPKAHGDEPQEFHPFGAKEFVVLFGCLFNPMRKLPQPDILLFERSLNTTIEQAFGALWKNLEALGNS